MADKSGLGSYILVRLILMIPTILILLTLVFVILRIVPGDPAIAALGPKASETQFEALRERLGTDVPRYQQYFNYVIGVFQGDLGESFNYRQPMWPLIKPRLQATFELAIYSFLFAIGLGVVIGRASAKRRGTVWDFLGNLYGIIIYSFPIFWLGMLFILIISVRMGVLPTSTRFSARIRPPPTVTGMYTIDSLLAGNINKFITAVKYLLLPAFTLGLYISGIFARMTRTNMLQTLKSGYVEAARARGIKENDVMMKYAFKNALIPIFTTIGLQFALTLGGAVLTEKTFSWPGMANFLVDSALQGDYVAVQAIATVFAFIVAITSIVIDIVNAFIDPRIRY
ncbi:MAG: ABC transporter permease [Candidatus Saliniplasma sp.]